MRLLSKKEIHTRRASEVRRDIDEGLKVAKKVDTLREVLANEESSLESFRVQTVRAINDEIKALDAKKMQLVSEVSALERDRESLRLPLTQEIEEKQRLLELTEREKQAFEILRVDVETQHQRLKEKEKNLARFELQLNQKATDLNKLQLAAERDKLKLEHQLKESQYTRQNTQKWADDLIMQLQLRESEVAADERDIEMRIRSIVSRETGLDMLQRQLDDRQKTLERAYERLKRPKQRTDTSRNPRQ